MISTVECKSELLMSMASRQFQRIFNSRAPTNIELNSAVQTHSLVRNIRELLRQKYLLSMKVLTSELRQLIQLLLQRFCDESVSIAEITCRIPHLPIQIFTAFNVPEEAPLTLSEYGRDSGIMDRITPAADFLLNLSQHLFGQCSSFLVDSWRCRETYKSFGQFVEKWAWSRDFYKSSSTRLKYESEQH